MIEQIRKMNVSLILGAALILCLVFGYYQVQQKNMYKTQLENEYQSSLRLTAGYLENVDNLLKKIPLATKPEQNAAMLAEVWKQAAAAHDNMARLPYNHEMIATAMKFLSQTSDVSYQMLSKSAAGESQTDEDWARLADLRGYAEKFSKEFNTLVAQAGMMRLNWAELAAEAPAGSETDVAPEALLGSMQIVSKQFQEYPALIYDGPFSDHIRMMKPAFIEGEPEITREDGEKIAREVLKSFAVSDVAYMGTADTAVAGGVPAYSYAVTVDMNSQPEIWIDITKAGGYPLLMLNSNHPSGENALRPVDAVRQAEEFLRSIGIEPMWYSYYETYEDVITINFAAVDDNGIIMYPDLVKVKLSLVDGTLLGFESMGYIMMHRDRGWLQAAVTEDDARALVSEALDISSAILCVIPREDKTEALCYEFTGQYGGGTYKVYINAETGEQEKIMELIISESGVLAQ